MKALFKKFIKKHIDCEKFDIRIFEGSEGYGMSETRTWDMVATCNHDGERYEVDA